MNKEVKKNILKAVVSLMISVLILLNVFAVNNFASTRNSGGSNSGSTGSSATFSVSEVISSVNEFNKRGESNKEIDAEKIGGDFAKGIKPVGEVLIGIAWVLSVGVAMILGVQYFASAANPAKQSKVKEGLIAFAIAIVILTLAFPIWRLTIDLVGKTTTSITATK